MYWTMLDVMGVLAVIVMVASTAWAVAYLIVQLLGARRRPSSHTGGRDGWTVHDRTR